MKFQNNGINIIKDFYHKCKEHSIKNSNPLNPSLPFEKSYMTDFLQGLINSNYNLKAVKIENGWLELHQLLAQSLFCYTFWTWPRRPKWSPFPNYSGAKPCPASHFL